MFRPRQLTASFCVGLVKGFLVISLTALIVLMVHRALHSEAVRSAEATTNLLLDRNMAIHEYFNSELKPKLFARLSAGTADQFEPSWMSSTYAVRQINRYSPALGPGYSYKEFALNPRNPGNEPDAIERDFLRQLEADPSLRATSQVQTIDGTPYFVTLRRGQMMDDKCRRCHGTPEDAPPGLLSIYGPASGFNRAIGQTVSAFSVRLPMSEQYARTHQFAWHLSLTLVGILLVVATAGFLVSRRLVYIPLRQLRNVAQSIAEHDDRLGEQIPSPFGKELRELTDAFNLMSAKLRRQRDELEQRVAERTRELHESEQRFQRLFYEAPIGAIVADLSGRFLQVNQALSRVLGYSEEELLQRNFIAITHPDDLNRSIDHSARLSAGELEQFELEKRYIRKDGHVIWARTSVRVIRDAESRPAWHLVMMQDITARKHAESLARVQQEEIAHLSRVASVGEMASSLAHELSQPLTAIIGYAAACQNAARMGQIPSKTVEHLQQITREANRAAEVVRRVRSYIRKEETRRSPQDVTWILRESKQMLREYLKRSEVTVTVEQSGPLPPVRVDPVQIQQVVINLLQNSAEAMEDVPANERQIAIRSECDGSAVAVSLVDNGPTISPEVAARIFEPFFTTKPSGLGLGLPICRSIIESHGGHIIARANRTRGMMFQFTLPLAESAARGS